MRKFKFCVSALVNQFPGGLLMNRLIQVLAHPGLVNSNCNNPYTTAVVKVYSLYYGLFYFFSLRLFSVTGRNAGLCSKGKVL